MNQWELSTAFGTSEDNLVLRDIMCQREREDEIIKFIGEMNAKLVEKRLQEIVTAVKECHLPPFPVNLWASHSGFENVREKA